MEWINSINSNQIIGIIGALASTVGVVIAIIQTMKYKVANRNLRKLRQIRNTQIWGSINLTLEAYDTLDEAKEIVEGNDVNKELSLKIVSARKSVVAQYLKLLEQAVLDEVDFDEDMAKEWFEKGLLENEWRYKVALRLAQGGKIAKQQDGNVN